MVKDDKSLFDEVLILMPIVSSWILFSFNTTHDFDNMWFKYQYDYLFTNFSVHFESKE